MAKEARTIQEFFEGPEEHPQPDRWARGRVAEMLAKAREGGSTDVVIDVRTTAAGTTSSENLLHLFVRTSDPPDTVVTALQVKMEEELEDTFAGQLRLNIKERHSSEHIGSFTRTIRPAPPSALSSAGLAAGELRGVLVIREPEAVRFWLDQLQRQQASIGQVLQGVAAVVGAAHPPAPRVSDSTPAALLQALTAIGTAGGGGAPAANAPTPPTSSYRPGMYGVPSWPDAAPPAPMRTDVSLSMLEDRAGAGAAVDRELTKEEVKRWALQNPTEVQAMLADYMRGGA